jgi:polysaccharide biosynthesis protein PelF
MNCPTADVCLIAEGGYPYMLGGVSSWLDALVRSLPNKRFHIVAISMASLERKCKFELPANVIGITDVLLDQCPIGRRRSLPAQDTRAIVQRLRSILTGDDGREFAALLQDLASTGLGSHELLDTRNAWKAMEQAYIAVLPNAPLVDFFWMWRFLVRSVLAVAAAPVPDAKVYHAVSTGYAGLYGAKAKCCTGRPLVLTEHGIYTNERRIEICLADWIYDSGIAGFSATDPSPELRDLWLDAFTSFSRISYGLSNSITTQYRANQLFQMQDGAPADKLRIIPNGLAVQHYAQIAADTTPRPPTVLLIGRLVPIKDIRTFILAVGVLTQLVPDAKALVIGPSDEDPAYAEQCHKLVRQQGLGDAVVFLGRVNDVKDYLSRVDLFVLTSLSEAQPISLLEAGACGLPAVTTDVGSCREIIEGTEDGPVAGRGGIVVGTCDPQALAEAMAAILLDPGMRADMGRVMRERVTAVYNEDRVSRMYADLYAAQSRQADQLTAACG